MFYINIEHMLGSRSLTDLIVIIGIAAFAYYILKASLTVVFWLVVGYLVLQYFTGEDSNEQQKKQKQHKTQNIDVKSAGKLISDNLLKNKYLQDALKNQIYH
jgi:cytochrome bd-type quinol oxidase subunit 1